MEGCGGYDANVILEGLGIKNLQGEHFQAAVKLFNEHQAEALELSPEQASVLTPGAGYYGRKVVPKLYNDYGPQCQDAGRAMAAKAAEQDKVFGMVQDGSFGTQPWVSEEITSRKRIHVGNANSYDSYWNARAPYAWDARWAQSDRAAVATASWVCRDLAGKVATGTGDPLIDGNIRKFGLIRTDSPAEDEIADALKGELSRCGATVLDIAQSVDVGQSQGQTPQTLARMRREGVTSIFAHIDWLNMATITQTATKQQYYPEWIQSGHHQNDWPARIYYFWDKPQQKNVMGTTFQFSDHQPRHDTTYEYRMFKIAFPDRDQPEVGWREMVWQVRTMFRGIYGAGPNLTAENWVRGLQLFCNPCGRADPLLPLQTHRVGHYAIWGDFGIIKWDPNREDTTEIDGLEGGYRRGFWRFQDGRRYVGTVRTPSTYTS